MENSTPNPIQFSLPPQAFAPSATPSAPAPNATAALTRAVVSAEGTVGLTQSHADLTAVDVADVDLLLTFRNGERVVIPNGALDALGNAPPQVAFRDGHTGLGDLFKSVGPVAPAKVGNLRVVTERVDGQPPEPRAQPEAAPLALEADLQPPPAPVSRPSPPSPPRSSATSNASPQAEVVETVLPQTLPEVKLPQFRQGVRIEVESDKTPSFAVDDLRRHEIGSPLPVRGNVLANDVEAKAPAVAALRSGAKADADAPAASAAALGQALEGRFGRLTLKANGSYSYELDSDNEIVKALRAGEELTDSFTYTATDGGRSTANSADAQLSIVIVGTNDAPIAVADAADGPAIEAGGTANGTPGRTATGNVLSNDSDPDTDDRIAVTAIRTGALADANGSTNGAVGIAVAGRYGTLVLNADGSYVYSVDDGAAEVQALRVSGETLSETFTYSVSDRAGLAASAELTIAIDGRDDAPLAADDSARALEAGGINNSLAGSDASGNVLANDSDVDAGDALVITAVAGGNVGSAVAGRFGSLTLAADGSYVYVLDQINPTVQALGAGETLQERFAYSVGDRAGLGATATLTITIDGRDDAISQFAIDDAATAVEAGFGTDGPRGADAVGNVLGNDAAGSVVAIRSGSENGTGNAGVVGSALAGVYGSLTIAADGSFRYVVDDANPLVEALRSSGQRVSETFTYSVFNAANQPDSAQLTVVVEGSNDAPAALADSADSRLDSAPGDGVARGNVLANDRDVDHPFNGETATVVAIAGGTVGAATTGTFGTLQLAADGSYSYTPAIGNTLVDALAAGETRSDSFRYTMRDAAGLTSAAELVITLHGRNDLASMVGDVSGALGEDSAQAASGRLVVSDVDHGEALARAASGFGAYGAYNVAADGNWTYALAGAAAQALAAGETATDSFVVASADGSATRSVEVVIAGANDAPLLTLPDSANAIVELADGAPGENLQTTVINGSLSYVDPDRSDLHTVTVTPAGAGYLGDFGIDAVDTATRNAAWSFRIDDAAIDFLGAGATLTQAYAVTVDDGHGGRVTQNFVLVIRGSGDAASIAGDTAASVGEDAASVGGRLIVSDVDAGESFAGAASGSAGHGSYRVESDGRWTYTPDNGELQHLGAGATLSDSFSVTSADGSASETVTLTIVGANDLPILGGVAAGNVTEDEPVAGELVTSGALSIDDPDDQESFFVAGDDVAGSNGYGRFDVAADGRWTYVADNAAAAVQALGEGVSASDSITVVSLDGSASRTITVTLQGRNDLAAFSGTDAGTLTEDAGGLTGTLSVADADAGQAHTRSASGATAYGSFSVDADGHWTYLSDNAGLQTLAAGATRIDQFVVVSSDGSASRTVSITITGVNDVAQLGGNGSGSVTEDSADADGFLRASGLLTISDVDAGEDRFLAFTDRAGSGGFGHFSLGADGSWSYVADNDAVQSLAGGDVATDSVTVSSADGSATRQISVTLHGDNDNAAFGGQITGNLGEDGTLAASGTLVVADADSGESHTDATTGDSAYGSYTVDADGHWTYTADNALLQWLGDGKTATDRFTVESLDGSARQNVEVTITGVNDLPQIAGSNTGSVIEDTADGADRLTTSGILTIQDADSEQSRFDAQTAIAGSNGYGRFSVAADGHWSYVADNGSAAIQSLGDGVSVTDSFTVTSVDGTGSVVVSVTLNGVNDAATISGVVAGDVGEDDLAPVTGRLTVGDADLGEAATRAGSTDTALGRFTVDAVGNWSYTVNAAAAAVQALAEGATASDSFVVRSADGTASATITLSIHGANDRPQIAGDDRDIVVEDVDIGGRLLTSGDLTIRDPDDNESAFRVIDAIAGNGGFGSFSLDADGAWTYVADNASAAVQALAAGAIASDSFTAVSLDGSQTHVVTVTLLGRNDDASFAGDTAGRLDEDTASISGSAGVTDPDAGESHTQATSGLTAFGSYSVDADGNWTYLARNEDLQFLAAGAERTDQFELVSLDGSATRNVVITITGVNDTAEIGGVDAGGVTEDVVDGDGRLSATGKLTIADRDQGQDRFAERSNVAGSDGYGHFSVAADGTWTYVADNALARVQSLAGGASVTDSFSVASFDGSATRLVTVTLYGSNDTASITGDAAASIDEDGASVTGSLSVADIDDGEALAFAGSGQSNHGSSFTVSADGRWTYTPGAELQRLAAGETLLDSFTVWSADGSASQAISITVTGNNDAPQIAGSDAAAVTEDAADAAGSLVASGILTIADDDHDQSLFIAATGVAGDAGYGVFGVDADGNWTYVADNAQASVQALADGATASDSFSVVSLDGSTTHVVTVALSGRNDEATISGDDSGSIAEDGTLESDGHLTVVDVDTGESATRAATGTTTYGSFSVDTAGHWHYTADNAALQSLAAGETRSDSFAVASHDGSAGQTITLTISGVNDVPVLGGSDAAEVTEEAIDGAGDLVASGSLTIDDADIGQSRFVAQGATVGSGGYGVFSVDADGAWSYRADNAQEQVQALAAGARVHDSFTVTSVDGSASRLVQVTLTGVNDQAAISGTTSASIGEDTASVGGTLTIADFDSGEAHSFASTGLTAGGSSYAIDADGHWTYAADNANLQYLKAGETLTDSFSIASLDGSATQTITVTLTGANDVAAIGGSTSASVTEDTALDAGNLVAGGSLSIVDADTGESALIAQTGVTGSNGYGSFSVDAAGHWTYVALSAQDAIQQLGAGQSLNDSLTVTSIDGSSSQTITVTINGRNDTPTISGNTSGSITEDLNPVGGVLIASGTLNISDVDVGQSVFNVRNNVASNNLWGVYSIDAVGHWTFTVNNADPFLQPMPAGGTATDRFTVTSADGTATVITITINGSNDLATISGVSSGSVTEDVGVVSGALSTGGRLESADIDTHESNFRYQQNTVGSNAYGVFNLGTDGRWTYDATNAQAAIQSLGAGQTLTDSFVAVSTDGSATRTVTVTIAGSNDLPSFSGSVSATLGEDAVTPAAGTLVVSDPDNGESRTRAVTGSTASGSYTVDTAGHWTYTANNAALQNLAAGQTRSDSFVATSHDGTTTQTITLTLTGSNDAPVARADTASAREAGGVGNNVAGIDPTGNLLTNDSDVDSGDSFSVGAIAGGTVNAVGAAVPVVTLGLYGNLTLYANGSYSYVVDNSNAAVQALLNGTLSDSFSVTIVDALGASSSNTLTVTISGANDAAVGNNDAAITAIGGSIAGNVLSNDYVDSAANGEQLTVTAVRTGTETDINNTINGAIGETFNGHFGRLTMHGDGRYAYEVDAAAANAEITRTGGAIDEVFTYTLRDNPLTGIDTAELTIRINAGLNGNDTLDATGSSAVVDAGAGDDLIRVSGSLSAGAINGGSGNDTLEIGGLSGAGFSLDTIASLSTGIESISIRDGAATPTRISAAGLDAMLAPGGVLNILADAGDLLEITASPGYEVVAAGNDSLLYATTDPAHTNLLATLHWNSA